METQSTEEAQSRQGLSWPDAVSPCVWQSVVDVFQVNMFNGLVREKRSPGLYRSGLLWIR